MCGGPAYTSGVARVFPGQQIAGCPTSESAFPRRNITPVSQRGSNPITPLHVCVCLCVCVGRCICVWQWLHTVHVFFMTHISRKGYLYIYQCCLFLLLCTVLYFQQAFFLFLYIFFHWIRLLFNVILVVLPQVKQQFLLTNAKVVILLSLCNYL